MKKYFFTLLITFLSFFSLFSTCCAANWTYFHNIRYSYPIPNEPFFKIWMYDSDSIIMSTKDNTIFLIAKERPYMFSRWEGNRGFERMYLINIKPDEYLVIKAPLYYNEGDGYWHREEKSEWSYPIDAQKDIKWMVVIRDAVEELKHCSDFNKRLINFVPSPSDIELTSLIAN